MQDEWVLTSAEDLCKSLGISKTLINEMLDLGIIEGTQQSKTDIVFTSIEIYRVRKVIRLNRDLGVNTAGAALIIDLLDTIEDLKRQIPK